jgi:diacylglycerol kinase
MHKQSGFYRSLGYALQGLRQSLHQSNMRTHVLITLLVIVAGIYAKLPLTEWILILLCIGLVITTELLNTAIEYLGDAISESHNPKVGHAKDLAAGAVLWTAVTAGIVGLLIFGSRLF